jgi:hypothetical protein
LNFHHRLLTDTGRLSVTKPPFYGGVGHNKCHFPTAPDNDVSPYYLAMAENTLEENNLNPSQELTTWFPKATT